MDPDRLKFAPLPEGNGGEAGELWATSDGGVGRLTETEWQVFAPDETLAQGVTALAATNDRLWLGTAAGWAAVELVGDSCRYAAVEAGSWVSEVLLDGQRDVWLAMDQGGVMRLSDEQRQTRELAGNVRRIALSPNGELWFADDRQPWLLRYRPGGGEDAWSRLPFDLDVITPESLVALAVGPNLDLWPVSYTHLRAHETVLDIVCRLLLEKKKQQMSW